MTTPSTALRLVFALTICLTACKGKEAKSGQEAPKAGAKKDEAGKKGDKAEAKAADKAAEKAGEAAKAGEAQKADSGEIKPPAYADVLAARFKAAKINFTHKDDAKRKAAFDAAFQPKIGALTKFKFPDTSVQLSAIELTERNDPTKKAAYAALKGMLAQLVAHDAEYKRQHTREDWGLANLLIYKSKDAALARKIAAQITLASRCGVAMGIGLTEETFAKALAASVTWNGTKATASDATDKYKDLGAAKVWAVTVDDPNVVTLVAQVADEATKKKVRDAFQSKYAAPANAKNPKLTGGSDQYDTPTMAILSIADMSGANDPSVKSASKAVTGQFFKMSKCLANPAPMQ